MGGWLRITLIIRLSQPPAGIGLGLGLSLAKREKKRKKEKKKDLYSFEFKNAALKEIKSFCKMRLEDSFAVTKQHYGVLPPCPQLPKIIGIIDHK